MLTCACTAAVVSNPNISWGVREVQREFTWLYIITKTIPKTSITRVKGISTFNF